MQFSSGLSKNKSQYKQFRPRCLFDIIAFSFSTIIKEAKMFFKSILAVVTTVFIIVICMCTDTFEDFNSFFLEKENTRVVLCEGCATYIKEGESHVVADVDKTNLLPNVLIDGNEEGE